MKGLFILGVRFDGHMGIIRNETGHLALNSFKTFPLNLDGSIGSIGKEQGHSALKYFEQAQL